MSNLQVTEAPIDPNMPKEVTVEALASSHDHFRGEGSEQEESDPASAEEARLQKALVEHAIGGGADVVGGMPNTPKGLKTAREVVPYARRIRSLVPAGKTLHFVPYFVINEDTTEKIVDECADAGIFDGKILPRYRTTLSDYGVVRFGKILPIVKHCGKRKVRVHGHFEHPSQNYTNKKASLACIPVVMIYLEETDAEIIWEHGNDGDCIPHWMEMSKSGRFCLTLAPQHLLTTNDETYGAAGEICKPSYGDPCDLQALNALVDLDLAWVMAGPDVAPHPVGTKHPPHGKCSCGAYHSPFLVPLYAHALQRLFLSESGQQTFRNFTSDNLRRLHKLPPASRMIKLKLEPFQIPPLYQVGPWQVQPFWAGRRLNWSIVQ